MNHLILGCMICVFFVSCSLRQEYKELVFYNLNESFEIILPNTVDSISPIGIEISITAKIEGKGILEIYEDKKKFAEFILEGNIDTTYSGEWYYETCKIRYTPASYVGGDSLKLRYRMI